MGDWESDNYEGDTDQLGVNPYQFDATKMQLQPQQQSGSPLAGLAQALMGKYGAGSQMAMPPYAGPSPQDQLGTTDDLGIVPNYAGYP